MTAQHLPETRLSHGINTPYPRRAIPETSHVRARALPYKATMTRTRQCCRAASRAYARSAIARMSCTEYAATEIDAKAMFSFLVREPGAKFPARLALGISTLVASRAPAPMPRLTSPKVIAPPVKATIDTKK